MRYIKKDIDPVVQKQLNQTNDYNCNSAKRYIGNKYGQTCAYCECKPEVGSYFQIEHFYEKSEYPQFRRDLRNLHYSCQRCNNLKEHNKTIRPILSPNWVLSCDGKCNNSCIYNFSSCLHLKEGKCPSGCKKTCPTPFPPNCDNNWTCKSTQSDISNHLRYVGYIIEAINDSELGMNTIKVFDLNNTNKNNSQERIARGDLVEDRIKVYVDYAKKIERIIILINTIRNNTLTNVKDLWKLVIQDLDFLIASISDNSSIAYKQMILDNFLQTIMELEEIVLNELNKNDL